MFCEWPSYDFIIFVRSHNFDLIVNIFENEKKYVLDTIIM